MKKQRAKEKKKLPRELTDVSRRTYLGAVAGSIFASPATATAKGVNFSEADWLEKGEKYTSHGSTFTVTDVFVKHSVSYYATPDSVHVQNRDGIQYVFVNLQFEEADTVRPPLSSLALIADMKQYKAGNVVDGVPLFSITDKYRDEMGETYHTKPMTPPESAVRTPPRYKNPIFTVGFAVPEDLQADQFGIGIIPDQKAEVAWKIGDEKAKKLQTSPHYELVSIEKPDKVVYGDRFEVGIEVKNNGDCPGTYRAVFGLKRSNHKREIAVSVPAGERKRQTNSFHFPPATQSKVSEDTVEYQLVRDNKIITEYEIPVEVK